MAEFFHMGGYAVFVWASYGAALVLMAGLVIVSLSEYRRSKKLVDKFETAEGGRPRRAAMPMSQSVSGADADGSNP